MKILNLVQGSPEWKLVRAQYPCASEAPVVMGASRHMTRGELIRLKAAGMEREFSDYVQRMVLAKGHEVEAPARAITEEQIGEKLYPVTALDDAGEYLASLDGATMAEERLMEHKQWNEELAAAIRAGATEFPDGQEWQLEQQLLVAEEAEHVIFVCSDGTKERRVQMEYRRVPGRADRLRAGWKLFNSEVATYVPNEIKERPAATEVTLALPALVIHAEGKITTSNMKEYGEALAQRLSEVRAIVLSTDQDFANAKASAKVLREDIQKAQLAKEQMLRQTITVGEAAQMIDAWCEDMRVTALQLEKDVEREDRIKKAAMIAKARDTYEQHIESLKADTGGPWIALPAPNWPEAIKGKRNFLSMQDALDTMLANAKLTAEESARKIRASLACMAEEGKGYEFLLVDRLAHIGKPVEDVRTLVRARITEHKAAEERRAAELAERERARIAVEERAKAEAAVRAEQERKQAEERAAAQAQAALAQAAAPAVVPSRAPTPGDVVDAEVIGKPSAASPGPATRIALKSDAKVTLGEINTRLKHWKTSAEGLAALGFEATRERGACLYFADDLDAIFAAMVEHIETLREELLAGTPF